MSGYNEDWQTRKAYLIRSLFNGVPKRGLSPVTEESTQSSNTRNDHSTQSSESQDSNQYYSSYEESDGVTLSESTGSLEAPAQYVRPTLEAGSNSELPPLIIEIMPNKLDEPPEFYRGLLIKMRRLYRKMFLERKDFDDNGQNLLRDDSVLIMESLSFNSNGYNADLESPESYESNIIEPYVSDILHNEEDNVINLIENDNNLISNDRNEINNDSDANESSDLEMNEMEQDSSDNEDPTYSQITFKADIHIDGRPHPAVRPSPIYERSQIEITPAPINILMAENEERLSENSSRDGTRNSLVSSRSSSSSPTPVKDEDLHYEETLSSGCEEQQFELNKEPHIDSMQTNEKPRLEVRHTLVSEAQFRLAQRAVDRDLILSPVLMSRSQYQRKVTSEVLETALEDNQALISAQSTVTEAKIDTEASQCDDNKSKQDSAFVLRFRRSGERSLLVGRDSSMLENIQNPETSPSTEENNDHTKELEVMRTPRIDISAESMPAGTNRLSSHIDDDNNNNSEHNMAVEDISNETVESLDGGQIITGQQKVSGDIDDILATIFDNSQEIVEQSSSFREKPRKRRFEEISVQTENVVQTEKKSVSWSDLRANFFVGTPKIFKLCSCVGHHCM